MIVNTLLLLSKDQLTSIKQNHKKATSAPKISTLDCLINWNKSANIIHNQIRAFSPKPGAYTYFHNKRVKLFNSTININKNHTNLHPGEIQYENYCFELGTGSGIINLHEIQIEGKKRMPVSQFITGFPKIKGDYFG